MMSKIEKKFLHKNLLCVVVYTPMGHRCGYVRLPEGVKVRRMDEDLFDVHGGITYAEYTEPATGERTPEQWIGFDCAHCGDRPDMACLDKYGMASGSPYLEYMQILSGKVWTAEMVEQECRYLADQVDSWLAAKEKGAKK